MEEAPKEPTTGAFSTGTGLNTAPVAAFVERLTHFFPTSTPSGTPGSVSHLRSPSAGTRRIPATKRLTGVSEGTAFTTCKRSDSKGRCSVAGSQKALNELLEEPVIAMGVGLPSSGAPSARAKPGSPSHTSSSGSRDMCGTNARSRAETASASGRLKVTNESVKLTHSDELLAPERCVVPMAQGVHDAEPLSTAYEPGAHREQLLAPGPAKEPGLQYLHPAELFAPTSVFPAGHAKQVCAPALPLVVKPGAHCLHEVELSTSVK